tara:strand:- start:16767 stop:17951 length:1185 start_codon:yes stop_codon:yes gene_type:complete
MGLITQTAAEYYTGSVLKQGNGTAAYTIDWPSNMPSLLFSSGQTQTANNNFEIFVDNVLQIDSSFNNLPVLTTAVNNGVQTQQVSFTLNNIVPSNKVIKLALKTQAIYDNKGTYQFVSLSDLVHNFMVAYVGTDKVIPRVKRSDVVYHAKRGLQEFSYDTFRSTKSQELTIPPSLSLVIPQDYVNYVELSWVDQSGVKHIIYPTTLTSNPYRVPIQDDTGEPYQDNFGENINAQQSLTNERWKTVNQRNLNGDGVGETTEGDVYGNVWWKNVYGQRYGLNPETSQKNGWFTIDPRRNVFAFSSNLANKIIILQYISDGLAYDEDTKIPKLAEEAMYAHILYSLTAVRPKVPEYIIQRYRRDRSAKLRNAKIRLSNIKMGAFTQVMRGKSKWIKH